MNGHRSFVAECVNLECPLHPFRMKQIPEDSMIRLERVIRRQCLQCADNDRNLIRRCTDGETCPLWFYRIGLSYRSQARLIDRIKKQRQLSLPGMD